MTQGAKGLIVVVVVASAVAVVNARPYAGSWNDGSRLATVECLVDHGTLIIDDSIFVRVSEAGTGVRSPYRGSALENGTLDKLYINGHFYSDKSPVPALLLAALYQVLQCFLGLRARASPEAFCWWLTVLSSGVAYVIGVASIFGFGKLTRLPMVWRLLLTASFGLGTVAVVYVQHVNNHVLLLGVAAAAMLVAGRIVVDLAADDGNRGGLAVKLLVLLGSSTGLGYTIDLGAGPMLLAATAGLVAWVFGRHLMALVWFAAGAFPWLTLHHVMNYAVGGTFGPANAVPEYLQWEGSPFQGSAMTGAWHHAGVLDFGVYALALLFGKRGFVGHNLGLMVLVGGLMALMARIFDFRFLIVAWSENPKRTSRNRKSTINNGHIVIAAYFICFSLTTWLVYAASSRNYSGANCSVRWFVPLLAPAYCGMALLLSSAPRYRTDFLLLSAWGVILMALAWAEGPWTAHMVPGFWFIQAGALGSWMWLTWRRRRVAGPVAESENSQVFQTSVRCAETREAERIQEAGVDSALIQVSK